VSQRYYYFAYIASPELIVLKAAVHAVFNPQLSRPCDSAGQAHMTAKPPIALSTSEAHRADDAVSVMIESGVVRPFGAPLGALSVFRQPEHDRAVLYLPVLGDAVSHIHAFCVGLKLPAVEYEGEVPHITLLTTPYDEADDVCAEAAHRFEMPDSVVFERVCRSRRGAAHPTTIFPLRHAHAA
jgi:hypothetical protein